MADVDLGPSLGKARLDLEVNSETFRRDMQADKASGNSLKDTLDALAAVSAIAEEALKRVKIGQSNAAESDASASSILAGVHGISDEARAAARELDNVRITGRQAAESDAAGDVIDRKLKNITGNANEARRAVESVSLAGAAAGVAGVFDASAGRYRGTDGRFMPGSGSSMAGRSGVGVGAFGSGYGRIGLLGTAIGAGVLTGPAAAPALGLLATLPALAAGGAGAVGVLALAFDNVAKAIGGDKKAFDSLTPAQQRFTQDVRSLDGWLNQLKQTAAGAMFPGLDKALHETLSPGTLNAITTAVEEMAGAVGDAGEEWGRYFGSAEFQQIFGPLMREGAHDVQTLADAALKLFDALGVLGRDAIPLTSWMTGAIDNAAKLADQWVHAKDASGGLAHGMDEAEASLRLVLGLLGALLHAAGALGEALYPVSKVAVKDLTDGLEALADDIHRNQGEIRDIVEGALAALVATVKTATAVIRELWPVVDKVEGSLGGWKHVFELMIGLKMASVINGWASALIKMAGAEALGGAEAKSAGLLANLTKLKLLGPVGVVVAVTEIVTKTNKASWLGDLSHNLGTLLHKDVPSGTDVLKTLIGNPGNAGAFGNLIWGALGVSPPASAAGASTKARANDQLLLAGGGQTLFGPSKTVYSQQDVYKLLLANGVPKDVAANLSTISARGEDVSGNIAALNNNPATGDYSVGLFQENFLGKMGVSRVARYGPQFGLPGNMSVPAFVKWLGMHPSAQAQIAYDIYQSQGYGAWTTAKGLGITDQTGSPFGTPPPFTKNLGPKPPKPPAPPVIPPPVVNLLNRASQNASKSKQLGNAGGTAQRYLENELDELNAAKQKLEKLTAPTQAGKEQIARQMTEVTNKIRDVQTLIAHSMLLTGESVLAEDVKARIAAEVAALNQPRSSDADERDAVTTERQAVAA